MNEEDRSLWVDFKANVTSKLTKEYQKTLCELHSKYFNHRYYEPCTCNGNTYKLWIADLDKLYGN